MTSGSETSFFPECRARPALSYGHCWQRFSLILTLSKSLLLYVFRDPEDHGPILRFLVDFKDKRLPRCQAKLLFMLLQNGNDKGDKVVEFPAK